MSNYNASVEIGYIRRIAFQDYVGARLLWNLGIFMPSLHLLHEAIEKYLKVLWASNQTFTSEKDIIKQLKSFNHDFKKIYSAIDPLIKTNLTNIMKKWGFSLYSLEGLRYGTNTPGVMYHDTLFKSAELFIREIRIALGEKLDGKILTDLNKVEYALGFKQGQKRAVIFKEILVLKRINPTKKEKKAHIRKFQQLLKGIA
jgi:hypothetical protein